MSEMIEYPNEDCMVGMAYEIQQAKIKKRPVRYFDQDFKEDAREN